MKRRVAVLSATAVLVFFAGWFALARQSKPAATSRAQKDQSVSYPVPRPRSFAEVQKEWQAEWDKSNPPKHHKAPEAAAPH